MQMCRLYDENLDGDAIVAVLVFRDNPWLLSLPAQIMLQLDKVHMILDEMIMNGHIVETNKDRILAPIAMLDKVAK